MACIQGFSLRLVGFVSLLAFTQLPSVGSGAPRQKLRGDHLPAAVKHLAPGGTLPTTERLNLAIGLPLRNQTELDALLQQLYDPGSPNYRRYLTPEEFTARFGPTITDYQAAIDFAKSNGLIVKAAHPNRVVLDVEGTVADIQKAFHVTLRTYRSSRQPREFYAPDVEPSVDLAVPILHVSGLDNYQLPHPNFRIMPAKATPQIGSGPRGQFIGKDFRNAYAPDTSLTGAGQCVGLLQFAGFYHSDVQAYAAQAGLPSVPITVVPVAGGVTNPADFGNTEVSLDIEMVMSMAPGLSKIYVFEAPGVVDTITNLRGFWEDLLSTMVGYTNIHQFSCSWTLDGLIDSTAEQLFQQMAAQGQSFFNASGDSDAFNGPIHFPSDSPSITVVGGTELTTTNGSVYLSERVWNRNNGIDGSSGGISTVFPIPYYQKGIGTAANQGSTTMRSVPDVAMIADNVYVLYGNGKTNVVGGTSVAAPLWAAFASLVNQQAASLGLPPVGFMNPALYAIANSADYHLAFHDVTNGNNFNIASPNSFSAVSGYDLCTGLGTPTGNNLLNLLNRLNPWIIRQPENQTAKAGDSVTFAVGSRGLPPLAYQWFLNGEPIPGATTNTYFIGRVQSIQAGTYTAVVSNSVGTVSSTSATLTVETSRAFGVIGAPFGYQIPASATWFTASGLPPGLKCDGPTGFISGIPSKTGSFQVNLEARNISGVVLSAIVDFVIADGEITSATGAHGILWVPFNYQITADNSPTWFLASGLPSGLLCDGPTGLISGDPTQTGTFLVHVQARNLFETVTLTITITISAPAITSARSVTGVLERPFGYQITADNNPVGYSASGLPAGLRCDNFSGLISGTPTETGTFPVRVEARNYWGTASATVSMVIVGNTTPAPSLNVVRTPNGIILVTWPSTSDGFVLEETQIQPIAWTNSPAPVAVQGSEHVAEIPATSTARFYRLRK